MKKLLIMICVFIVICFFIFNMKAEDNERKTVNSKREDRGIFISYIDLGKYVKNEDSDISKENVRVMLDNISRMKFNMIVLQVVSFSDAIYESNIYPWSRVVSKEEGIYPGYDILEYFIEEAHKRGILVYAWINPYRVRSSYDIESISEKNPAYKYLDTDTLYINGGIYYNPAKEEVLELIVSGVEEIVTKYKIDGLLFDDYFYPALDVSLKDYEEYLKKENVTFEQYKLMIINRMVERVHEVCKKNKIIFGISPDGNIENNYNKVFADVKLWLSSEKYIDFIMPQVYYGFFNELKPFSRVIKEWNDLIKVDSIDMYVALAFYKVGSIDNYAKEGKFEWQMNDNVIMKEIILSRNLERYKGFVLFRYGNLFDSDMYTTTTLKEIENIKKIVK